MSRRVAVFNGTVQVEVFKTGFRGDLAYEAEVTVTPESGHKHTYSGDGAAPAVAAQRALYWLVQDRAKKVDR